MKKAATGPTNDTEGSKPARRDASAKQRPAVSDAERIASKEAKYTRAREITGSTGLINTDGVSVKDAAGEKVMLVEFWTYSCFNCQNAQPHINALYERYRDDGLLVVGVHSPEFGFEKDISNVREAVARENIEYPVVLDNNYAIWNAYDQRFWPAWYLIDADGSSATGISAKAPTRRPIRRSRSCSRRGIASRVDSRHLALFRDPQDGIVGDVAAQGIQCQAVADHAFVVVALP